MACLPNLVALGVGYPQYQNHDQPHESYHLPSTPLPHLQQLMIQTAFFDVSDADELWNWTCSLIPHEGSLQSFSLESHTEIVIPLSFVTRLIRRHGWSLTQFRSGFAQATPEVLIYLCRNCPNLALLGCPVVSVDMVRQVLSIPSAVTNCLLASDRKSYRTRQEPSYIPMCLVDPSWCRGYHAYVLWLPDRRGTLQCGGSKDMDASTWIEIANDYAWGHFLLCKWVFWPKILSVMSCLLYLLGKMGARDA